MQIVTMENWKANSEFREFLGLHFDLRHCRPELRAHCLSLLPVCVAEGRLFGAITNIILKEAIHIWNKPLENHAFERGENNWRYRGVLQDGDIFPTYWDVHYGKLIRVLTPGTYCEAPSRELFLPRNKEY